MWMYLAVFLCAFAVDLIPVIAPPAWTLMVFFLVKFHLNPWVVLVAGVSGSTLGKYIFSLYVPKITDKIIKRHKREELEFMGKKLGQKLWQSWLFVFIYSLTPLSTTALFTAAAIAKVKAGRMLPPFFAGKFVTDAVLIFTGRYAVRNLTGLVQGALSAKGILIIVATLVVTGGFLFVDWRALLEKKQFKFNFKIWK
jgi:membrane protein DedA with SNARE-associated domain